MYYFNEMRATTLIKTRNLIGEICQIVQSILAITQVDGMFSGGGDMISSNVANY